VGVLDASTSPPKKRYALSKDNIIKLIHPGNVDDKSTPGLSMIWRPQRA
jgi:putative transposase